MRRPTWLDLLVGAELRDAFEVDVHFPNEAPLTTGDLVLETDRGWFQLISLAPDREIREMQTPSDVKLIGDWSDRSGVVLRTTGAVDIAFRIARVDYVQRGASASPTSTVGVWLLDHGPAVRRSILLDAEAAELGAAERLWSHLTAISRDEPEIVLFGAR
jgi:hypothetical protein